MSQWVRLKHSEIIPGQEVELLSAVLQPRRAVFRFRTTRLAVFDVESEVWFRLGQRGSQRKRMWFHLLSDGTLSDELLRRPWSISGERLSGPAYVTHDEEAAHA